MSVRAPAGWMLAGALTSLLAAPAWGARVVSGPMVGYTDMHTTTVWLQTDGRATATLEYWPEGNPKAPRRQARVKLGAETDHAGQARLSDLEAGTRYAYRVLLDGKPAGPVLNFNTQVRWQWRNQVEPPDFTALMGSCHYVNDAARDRDGKPFGAGYPIFGVMASQKPDLTLWLGDNTYLRENETTSAEGMAHRYRMDRALPEVQPLLRTGQHLATWDDHDFGPDDSNSSFALKGTALELFKRYWANGSYGLPETPGVFGVFSQSDVDFFLTDNRWYRDSDRDVARPGKAMFGEAQMRWLKNALLMSTATFKVIVGGSQFLNDIARTEGWTHFPLERQDFMDWLLKNRVNGVLFISGDRHFTELARHPRADTYPLYDLTCSPLTAGAFSREVEARKATLVPGTMVTERNFCSLRVEGPRKQRVITLKSFDATGRELWSHRLPASELQSPAAAR